jgi:hypothetical protein
MSFLTGTQCELLYCLPITGASNTGTNSTSSGALISLTGGASSPAFFLPAYFFSDTYGIGKSLLIQGGGILLGGPATQTTRFALYADTAVGTQGTLLCATGAFSPFGTTVSQTGAFMFEVLLTCTSVGTAGVLNTVGRLFTGQAGNTATAATGVTMLMNAASQPTFNNATGYFIELYANFGATTTTQAVTLTNLLVWGLN